MKYLMNKFVNIYIGLCYIDVLIFTTILYLRYFTYKINGLKFFRTTPITIKNGNKNALFYSTISVVFNFVPTGNDTNRY